MKTFTGEEVEIVDATSRERITGLEGRFKFTTQGQIPGLITKGNKLFFVVAQRLSTKTSAVYLIHNYNGTIYTQTIHQDPQMSIVTNAVGTIEIQYNNSRTNVFVGVLEL